MAVDAQCAVRHSATASIAAKMPAAEEENNTGGVANAFLGQTIRSFPADSLQKKSVGSGKLFFPPFSFMAARSRRRHGSNDP
jgi:hypothetical protein